MGLFDKFKKKASAEKAAEKSSEKPISSASLENDVTQDVAICMNALKITSMPMLKFIKNDNGFFEDFYQSHMDDPQVAMVRKEYGDEIYLNLLGCHAFGAGAYMILSQARFNKPVAQFTEQDIAAINNSFRQTDPYELALKTLGYAPDGNNKKCLDRIILIGMESYRKNAGSNTFDKECLRSYMQVMYNAGATLVLRE